MLVEVHAERQQQIAAPHGHLRRPPRWVHTPSPLTTNRKALGIPASYVLATEDIAVPPGEYAWAPRFPDRLGVTPVTCPGSHEALFTQSEALAAAIAGA